MSRLDEVARLLRLAVADRPPVDPAKLAKAALELLEREAESEHARRAQWPSFATRLRARRDEQLLEELEAAIAHVRRERERGAA